MRVIKLEDSDLATMSAMNKETKEVKVHLTFQDATKNTVLEMTEETLFGLTNTFCKMCTEIIKSQREEK